MGLYSKSILIARRLSVLGLFVTVFSIFFGGFYYRYMPANQEELNTRGFRILNQLAANMTARNKTLKESFGNAKKLNSWKTESWSII